MGQSISPTLMPFPCGHIPWHGSNEAATSDHKMHVRRQGQHPDGRDRRSLPRGPGSGVLVQNNLVPRRAERGRSQAQLAERLGVSGQTFVSIERGRFDPLPP